MEVTSQTGNDQAKHWNGPAGVAWVDTQAVLDALFKPFEAMLVEAASARPGSRVLDVGCGTGSTTLAVARRHGATGRCVGIDISEPMIALARARAEREGSPARFICADAQDHGFEAASFDLFVSRFGVMFFADPVKAFANLRRAASDTAELRLIAWRSAADNPFMTTAERAAAPLLPNLPARRPNAPGQFAFADPQRVDAILRESGWADVEIRPIDVDCTMPEAGLIDYLSRLGPVGLMLREADEATRKQVVETVRAAFEPYVDGDVVRFTAACWMVEARAASV